MATRSVSRAVQQAYHSPSRLFPFLVQQQGLCAPADKEGALHVAFSLFSGENSQQQWVPRSGLGFPLHTDAGKSHVFCDTLSSSATLSPHFDGQLHATMQRLGIKPSLLLSQDKVQMQYFTYLNPESLWKFTNSKYLPPSTEMDEVILPSQNEDFTSPMMMSTKRTFNPSTIVRKRRHGFLARKATVGGRRVLARRLAKGRRRLSA